MIKTHQNTASGISLNKNDLTELETVSKEFETATPQTILDWACNRYQSDIVMATSFGAEGMVLIHMLAEIIPNIEIFNLDTGYQFEASLQLIDKVKERYGIEIKCIQPEANITEYEKIHDGPVYLKNPDKCCYDRKIVPLKRGLKNKSAWITAIRRDQSPTRKIAPIVGWDRQFNLAKINPLANWKKYDVWEFIKKNDIPYNSLYDEGYTSIGCWPCTQKPTNSDERSGRWQGFNKTECGIHTKKTNRTN
jgi:phosphoadenosine phosphosulfate reductase